MVDLSLVDAVQLILRSVVHVPTAAFLIRCSALQLEPVEPAPQIEEPDVDPPGFPQYDASHTFVFQTDNKAPAAFDILGYRGRIIQVRLSVHYRRPLLRFLSSKCDEHVGVVLSLLVSRYGPGARPIPDAPLMFSDGRTDAYLSRISAGSSETLFVNVGDREMWRLAGGVVSTVES
jgi:hypothetical protein